MIDFGQKSKFTENCFCPHDAFSAFQGLEGSARTGEDLLAFPQPGSPQSGWVESGNRSPALSKPVCFEGQTIL